MRIHKLYSHPESFRPIEFEDGINLILGEKDDSSEKTNGVGKSMSIEFINFCLLQDFSKSRVSRVPSDAFPHEAFVCLDFSIGDVKISSKRSVKEQNTPTLIVNEKEKVFSSCRDARDFISHLLFGSGSGGEHPSFRHLLGPIIRDERSEFKSIVKWMDTSINAGNDFTPHLYLLGISPENYNNAKAIQRDIDNTNKAKNKLKKDVEELTGKNFKQANADLNELTWQVEKIKSEMDALENTESYDILKDELVSLEIELESERTKESVLKSELSKYMLFKGDNYIDHDEVESLYRKFKSGLGEAIKRELDQVVEFKKRIDHFQESLIDTRKKTLQADLDDAKKRLRALDARYQELLKILDHNGVLKTLKTTIIAYQKKLGEQASLATFINKYDDYESEIKHARQERNVEINSLDLLVADAESTLKAFETQILEIHNYVMGNRRASFSVEINDKKEVVVFDLRIQDDRGHSNEREKVFIYDIGLLTTPELESNHPGLLVHDNIFDVDQDTLVRSLNFLVDKKNNLHNKQYLLTINKDKLSSEDLNQLKFSLDDYVRAVFTKNHKFLGQSYQEL